MSKYLHLLTITVFTANSEIDQLRNLHALVAPKQIRQLQIRPWSKIDMAFIILLEGIHDQKKE